MTNRHAQQTPSNETATSDTSVRIVSAYLAVQAFGTLAWWVLLLVYPASIPWFQPATWPNGALLSFWMADFVLIMAGSLLAAICVWHQASSAATLVWVVAAVTWYPTLVCIATSLQTGEAWIASAMMVCMAGLSLSMATIHGNTSQSPATIRVASMSSAVATALTLGQTVIFWGTFLWVLPMGIVELQIRLGWQVFQHPLQSPLSGGLFLVASSLGLWSGITMAIRGDGTPLPTATAPRLVIAGPYRYVRNPMALAGIVQGIAVGWFLGSLPVIAYALCGAVVWHVFVRPVEERDLQLRFGADYHRYQKHVRLWIPTVPFF
ncbi:methyltransferase family protein [Rhodopirellula europaea]|uniref:Protein-S-isoprenylcysteine O-methyltransferase n=1 Tax=Rhodopirellula europaea SH398 TaxID=1263868 RepID=M5S235_9BACT|nr:isoprenylcysteine carboxylmethyltransferase family protein [Rhodopirellula europaea]EMI25610.1 protein-S-isoprenylcysteine O-methyltransferase [Rhodopirellula europaea SH398]